MGQPSVTDFQTHKRLIQIKLGLARDDMGQSFKDAVSLVAAPMDRFNKLTSNPVAKWTVMGCLAAFALTRGRSLLAKTATFSVPLFFRPIKNLLIQQATKWAMQKFKDRGSQFMGRHVD